MHTLLLVSTGDRAPVINQSPSDIHVFVGATFSLTCEANPLLIDTYQWMKDGVVLSSSENLIINNGEELRVLNARPSHSGVYQCVVTNVAGTASANATVQVTNTVITCDGEWA